jgi:hypothetical protein
MSAHEHQPTLREVAATLQQIATIDHKDSHQPKESEADIRRADDVIAKFLAMSKSADGDSIRMAIDKDILSDKTLSDWLVRYLGKHGTDRLTKLLLWRWDIFATLPN